MGQKLCEYSNCNKKFPIKKISKTGNVYTDSRKRFCSKSCSASHNNIGVDRHSSTRERTGRAKGELPKYNKTKSDSRTKSESRRRTRNYETCIKCNAQFAAPKSHNRLFCGRDCYNIHQQKARSLDQQAWLSGELGGEVATMTTTGGLLPTYRRLLIESSGPACSECGFDKVHKKTGKPILQVDHIDGDPTNNRIDNLRVLCPNCHAGTENFGALNHGNTHYHEDQNNYQSRRRQIKIENFAKRE